MKYSFSRFFGDFSRFTCPPGTQKKGKNRRFLLFFRAHVGTPNDTPSGFQCVSRYNRTKLRPRLRSHRILRIWDDFRPPTSQELCNSEMKLPRFEKLKNELQSVKFVENEVGAVTWSGYTGKHIGIDWGCRLGSLLDPWKSVENAYFYPDFWVPAGHVNRLKSPKNRENEYSTRFRGVYFPRTWL